MPRVLASLFSRFARSASFASLSAEKNVLPSGVPRWLRTYEVTFDVSLSSV
jgi:hypothetical protein